MLLALSHVAITSAFRSPAAIRLGRQAAISSRNLMPTAPLGARRHLLMVEAAASTSDTDFAEYTAKTPFLFPGQGAQTVGMAGELCETVPAAKALFDEASEILGYDLLEKCVNGPKEELDSTVISQPAIFVSSMAAVEKMKQEMGEEAVAAADVACGLSLGEYTALCFAGAISFADGVKIVKTRGEAMQAASEAASSGMASVIGLKIPQVEELCKKAAENTGASVQIANFLCPGNYAVSGAMEAIDNVAEIAKPEFKARMTVKLAVAGAFHTDFMAPAVPKLKEVLDSVEIKKPRIPVISNVDAQPHSDPAVLRDILTKQVTSPVQWEQTVANLFERGYEQGYELGPGKVIAGIIKRVDKKATITNIEV